MKTFFAVLGVSIVGAFIGHMCEVTGLLVKPASFCFLGTIIGAINMGLVMGRSE